MSTPNVPTHERGAGGITFWLGMAIGAATVAFGVRGILMDLRSERVVNLSLFVGASGIIHDAVWAPLLVAGGLLTRQLPQRTRRPVRIALALSVGLALFAVPVLAGPSTRVRNPTVLPLDYGRNLVLTLVALWCVCGAAIGYSYWRDRVGRSR